MLVQEHAKQFLYMLDFENMCSYMQREKKKSKKESVYREKMAEWFMALDCKSSDFYHHKFESCSSQLFQGKKRVIPSVQEY